MYAYMIIIKMEELLNCFNEPINHVPNITTTTLIPSSANSHYPIYWKKIGKNRIF